MRFRSALAAMALIAPLSGGCDDGTTNTTTDAPIAEVDVVTTGSVSGTIMLPDGSRAEGASVSLGGGTTTTTTGADGAFRFEDLDPGSSVLTATLEGYVDAMVNVTVTAGVESLVDLTLGAIVADNQDPVISAFAVTPQNNIARGGMADATATASDPDGDTLRYVWDATGGFSVIPLDDGTRARVDAPSAPGVSGELTLTVTDGRGGSVSQSLAMTTSSDNTAPVINSFSSSATQLEPGTLGALDIDATDADGDPLTYTWLIDNADWNLVTNDSTGAITAANAFGSTLTITVTVEDGRGGRASTTLGLQTTPCTGGLVDCDANADNGCEEPSSGLGFLCANRSCSAILDAGLSRGDGPYWIAPDGNPLSAYETWCDMNTDGGGWILLGTISGGDEDRWNVETGIWNNTLTLGSPDAPWDDFKSRAWSGLDTTGAELMLQRRFDGTTRTQVVLDTPCLRGKTSFGELFATYDPTRACTPSDMRVVKRDPTGLASTDFEAGVGFSGLASATTNGLCWFGEDNAFNTFKGHLVWHDDVNSPDCNIGLHAAGIGVYSADTDQHSVADITGTSWLLGTDYTSTAISIFARERTLIEGALTPADPGTWADGSLATSCNDYRNPSSNGYFYGGSTGDGVYRIDPDGGGSIPAANVFCDMTTDGGGWTALAANGNNADAETTDAANCYPLITNNTAAGCGDATDLMNDFTLSGEVQAGISWRRLLAVSYGDTGYDDKLAHFGIVYSSSVTTRAERNGGSRYQPGDISVHGEMRCPSDGYIVHYTTACTRNNYPTGVACNTGTVFGHSVVANMNDSGRGTFGFTDAYEHSTTGASSIYGIDDYQDGWSCGDSWEPQAVRGERMIVLVR